MVQARPNPAAPHRFATAAALAAVALSLALAGGGCKKKQFQPGVYSLVGVFQTVHDAEGDETNRTELRISGGATFTFDYDGEFLVTYSNYGVGFERPCSGHYRGQYVVNLGDLVLDAKKMSLPSYCRPDRQRSYRWEIGWGETLTLTRHWEDNQYIVYRLEPDE